MLTPGELAQLGQWLGSQGFGVTSHQLLAAGRLVNGTRRFVSREALAPYLAPLFCSDAQMQRRFAQCYRDWLAQIGLAQMALPQGAGATDAVAVAEQAARHISAIPAPTPAPTPAAAPPVVALIRQPQAGWRRWLPHSRPVVAVLLALVLVCGLGWWWLGQVPQPLPDKSPLAASTLAKPEPEKPMPTINAFKEKAAPPVVVPKPAPNGTKQQWPAAALLLLVLVYWASAHLRRARFLQNLPDSIDSSKVLHLLLGNPPQPPFAAQLKRLGPALRRHQRAATRELDVYASLHASVRQGGIVKPVFGGKVEPHYLILLDRNSPRDQFAQWADAMLANWLAQGVDLACYRFSGDLHTLHPHAPAATLRLPGWQTLAQLAQRYAGARLIIISDGASLIDRYSGQVSAQLGASHGFTQPLLLTPTARNDWTVREWLIHHAGLAILPLDEPGLVALAQFYARPAPLPGVDERACQELGPSFWHNQDLWLDRVAPPAAEISMLVAALRQHLGLAGLAWLAAGAACPKLDWGVLVALGAHLRYRPARQAVACQPWQLADAAQEAASLQQLVSLPWLRHGFMPVWLRQALLAQLPHACHWQIRHALLVVLGTLKAAPVAGDEVASGWQLHQSQRWGFWAVLWQRWRKVPEAADDKLFVSVAGGNWALRAPWRWLRQVLYPQGMALAGPKRGLVLAGVCGALVLAVWTQQAVTPVETGAAIAARPLPTASASTLILRTDIANATPAEVVPVQLVAGQVIKDCDVCPEMVVIPGGQFVMGDDKSKYGDEKPAHRVSVPGFLLGKFEVTQGQWRALMGSNPSYFKDCGDNCPVEYVSWGDAQAYVKKLSDKTGQPYRLPTEAEWEYAARAGSSTQWSFGDDETQLGRYVWYGGDKGNAEKKTHAVGGKLPNQFGLYMHGSVLEWVEDCWHVNYRGAPANGSAWLQGCSEESSRVLRGGGFVNTPVNLRAAIRNRGAPTGRVSNVGVRVARTPR